MHPSVLCGGLLSTLRALCDQNNSYYPLTLQLRFLQLYLFVVPDIYFEGRIAQTVSYEEIRAGEGV